MELGEIARRVRVREHSLTPLSRMHSASFTALSRLVAFLLPPLPAAPALPVLPAVPVLPFSADPFQPPALIRATMARAASGRSFYSCLFPASDDCADTSS
jgi:hypothetical protein